MGSEEGQPKKGQSQNSQHFQPQNCCQGGIPRQNKGRLYQKVGSPQEAKAARQSPQKREDSQKNNYSIQEEGIADYEKELSRKTQQLEKNLEKAKEIGKKMKDPKKYKELRAEHMENFIKGIEEMDFSSATQTRFKSRAVLGGISTGKSSLINIIMGSKLPVGHGETTLKPQMVPFSQNLHIWDTPGENDEYNITKIEVLKELCQCDRIFVLYESSLKKVDTMVKVVNAVKPGCGFLIRTKCDMFNEDMNKTIYQELAEDQKVLRSWGINPEAMPIYCTSAISRDAFDNQIVHRLFTTNSREPSQYKPDFNLQKQKESSMPQEPKKETVEEQWKAQGVSEKETAQMKGAKMNHCRYS